MDAITMLKEDHKKVKVLFTQFASSQDQNVKKEIAEEAIVELQIHTMLEEEFFYPAISRQAQGGELITEAEEEHHVVDLLIDELLDMKKVDEHYEAKFKVLSENVRHHIDEEEGQVMPKATKMGESMLNELGQKMAQRKQKLESESKRRPTKARSKR